MPSAVSCIQVSLPGSFATVSWHQRDTDIDGSVIHA